MPVTQQVNVATNTDAKIGIKVQKNGEYLSLDGSTLSVKVGNEIVYDPIMIDGTRAELTASTTTTNTTLSTDVAGSDYYGYNVPVKTIKVQVSYDGTTWQDATPSTSDIVGYWYDLTVDNRRPKALINMANPQIFNVVFGPDAGKQLTELAWTDKTRIQMNANTYASWNITSYPCYLRICAGFQKPNYQEMLSADAELTNGYVTFPISIGDEPRLTQDTVVVNKESIVTNCDKNSKMPPAAVSILKVFTSDIIPEGMLVNPGAYMQYGSSELSADGERITGYTTDGFLNLLIDQATYGVIAGNFGTVNGVATNPNKWYICKTPTAWVKEWDLEHPLDYIEVTKPAFIQCSWVRSNLVPQPTSSDKYMFFHCSWKTEETKANFKLNVNGFKSQQGDKEYMQELPDIPTNTANLSGTYADNTEFSFDIFYK